MIRRAISQFIEDSLKDFPAVLINGARQVGKSTLALMLKENGIIEYYVTLDDIGTWESARNDPDGFINQFKGSLAIDELQRVPDLMRAIKKSIDEDRRPGRFLLTGSANILSYPGVNESMAGRTDIIAIEGLSLGEILSYPRPLSFIEDLFSCENLSQIAQKWNQTLALRPVIEKAELLDFIFFGSYPEVAIKKNIRFRDRWFSSYQSSYIERDVRNLTQLQDIISFAKLYTLLGLNTGNLVNLSELGMEAKLDHRTVTRYVEILELTFQLNLLKPWYSNDRKKYVKTPKVFVNDSGQACYLQGISDPKHLANHPALGALFETWVWSEIRKMLTLTSGIQSYFYRTYQGQEVDFLLSRGSTFWGIETKWSENINKSDFKSLTSMIESMGQKAYGLILYTGKTILPFSDKLMAVPISLLM